jgi:preprotein translocase subunit SecD
MKEETRAGKTKEVAVRLGFTRAWSSIRDSNISSLITSAILYYFGTGIVRGFALTLAIGIIISMFSAIIVTRNLLKVFDKS